MFALLTWLAIKWYDSRDERCSHQLLFMIIYLLGLGVGFHLGSLFVYPGIFLLILMSGSRKLHNFDLFLMTAGGILFMLSTAVRKNAVLVFLLAFIPFVVNEITHATSPLKLFEYFAGGKPVISSPMPECAAFPEVRIARNAGELAGALDAAGGRAFITTIDTVGVRKENDA